MNLKPLVNDKALWDSFQAEINDRIAGCHKKMEQYQDMNELLRMQGEVRALRSLLALREKVNAPDQT